MASSSSSVSSTTPDRATTNRRRQRSVRVTVAIALLSVATLAVVVALPAQSPLWLSVAAVFALACGWASARIVYTELLQSRREAQADRSAQAQAYKVMFSTRAEEHAEFTTTMTDRLARRDKDVEELEATVVLAEKRAIEAESRVQRESRRANAAEEKVVELEQALEVRRAEEADELASWGDDLGADLDTVVDLLAWEEKVTASSGSDKGQQKHA
ncbi:MAG: hypothetical protein ACXVEU_10060 [Nocardioidaceae bacterium]